MLCSWSAHRRCMLNRVANETVPLRLPCCPRSYLSTADSKTNVSLLLPLGVQDPGAPPNLCCSAARTALFQPPSASLWPGASPAFSLRVLPTVAGFMPLYAHIMALTCAVGGANASDAGYAVIGGIVPQGERQAGSLPAPPRPQHALRHNPHCTAFLPCCHACLHCCAYDTTTTAQVHCLRPTCMPHADVLAATNVTLPVRAKQADAIRTLWATTSLLPRLAASKRRVLFIQ